MQELFVNSEINYKSRVLKNRSPVLMGFSGPYICPKNFFDLEPPEPLNSFASLSIDHIELPHKAKIPVRTISAGYLIILPCNCVQVRNLVTS